VGLRAVGRGVIDSLTSFVSPFGLPAAVCLASLRPYFSGGGAWGPCGLSTCGGGEARTQPPDTGNEVTTHNGGYSGEALRAHSRPPGPGALAGWRPAALYYALCRGYRTAGAELRGFAEHTGRAVHRRVRSCEDNEHTPLRQGRERAEHPHGWQRCGAEELRNELRKG